jgi:hypothetical protein
MVSGSKYFHARDVRVAPDAVSRWRDSEGRHFLPLYEGRMLGAFDCSRKGWVRGRGRTATWRLIDASEAVIEPQWVVAEEDVQHFGHGLQGPRVGFIRVTSNTNARTMYASVLPPFPTGFTACQLQPQDASWVGCLELVTILNSFAFDYVARRRVCGLDIAWFHVQELPIPVSRILRSSAVVHAAAALNLTHPALSVTRIALRASGYIPHRFRGALMPAERLRLRCSLDAVAAVAFGLTESEFRTVLVASDHPIGFAPTTEALEVGLSKAFWRVDADTEPELRHTVLTLVAFHDLQEKIRACGGNCQKGIEAFLAQNDGEGWMLPETLRLADYGLGHDERAKQHQPVASRLGPRFYDWQLAQSPEESWRECHLHARNLLGEAGYRQLLDDIEAERRGEKLPHVAQTQASYMIGDSQGTLFE